MAGKHPFNEHADSIDELLREQRDNDRKGTGAVIIVGGLAREAELRAERDRLRYLASVDIREGWPWEDGVPPIEGGTS